MSLSSVLFKSESSAQNQKNRQQIPGITNHKQHKHSYFALNKKIKTMSQLFRKAIEPMRIYRKLKGDLLVKTNFSIPPTSPWPAQYHNMKLGAAVSKIRQEIKKNKLPASDMVVLAKINFVVDVKKYQSDRILLGYQEYKRMHGHCKLPVSYVIPNTNDWHELVRGLKLGSIQDTMRQHDNRHETIREAVSDLGFNLIPTEIDFSRTLSGLIAYKAIHGDVNVVFDFVVPHDDARYPENTWGMKLGLNLHSIRCKGTWSEHRAQLEDLGVNYKVKSMRREPFEVIFSALESYKAIHGDANIVQDFVVPHGDARYPENTWGMKLGKNLSSIRCQGIWSAHRTQLEALGVNFEVKPIRNEPFEVIYSALESYFALHGDVNIVRDFVIPSGDARYPENTWGMKLGSNLHHIRCNGAWSEHRAQLDALGVNFEVKPMRPFKVIYSALESYKAIHGDVNIVRDFVVPHGDVRYSENTWGIKLGFNLHNIRINGVWSEHRAQLEALGVNYEVRPKKKSAKA